MLFEALAFPRAGDDWLETLLVGGVLSLLGVLVVPAIVVNGYLVRVLRAGVEGDETLPRFTDWVDLFVDGLLVLLVELVYVGVTTFVLAGLVFVGVALGWVTAAVGVRGPVRTLGAIYGSALLLVGLFGFLLAAYLLPAALANFARTDDVVAAFHLGTVARAAFTADYLVAVVLAIAVSVVLGVVGGLLLLVLVGVFVLFALQVVVYHLFGQGFARGLASRAVEQPAAEPSG